MQVLLLSRTSLGMLLRYKQIDLEICKEHPLICLKIELQSTYRHNQGRHGRQQIIQNMSQGDARVQPSRL